MVKLKHLYAISLALLSAMTAMAAEDYGIPGNIQDGNILHCFDWKFTDIKSALPEIAKAGFGAVQVSPVQGNAAANAEWFYAYMPYDFAFKANGNGSKAQLTDLCSEAHSYGIKIIVDVVCNHVNGATSYRNPWWNEDGRLRSNGGINYGDRYSITHNQLGDYPDVNSENADVQARAREFVEELKECGVDGIRWDAAKHIGLPSESCDFWKAVTSVEGMYHYGEILDGPGGDKYTLLKEYSQYMTVTDTEYSDWCLSQVQSGNVPSSYGSWTPNGIAADKVLYWGESHDTYSNDGGKTKFVQQARIDRAWAIGACRAGSTSLYFSRPSETERTAIKMGQKGSTHFTSAEIAAVNHLRNKAVGTPDYYTAEDGVACVTRKGVGACIVVGAGGSKEVSITNGGEDTGYAPVGEYIDEVSGNTFKVTTTNISGKVGSTGIAVIYVGSTHEGGSEPDPGIDPDPVDGLYTVYFDNSSSNWSKVNVYIWDSGNGGYEIAGKWPGSATEADAETGYYKYSFEYTADNAILNIIWNNGSSQTADLDLVHCGIYNKDGFTGEYVSGLHNIATGRVFEAAPEYYNLQGVRVIEPSRGLYIVRRGNTITKEIVR